MARIFITGSSGGLGFLAGKHLAERGNDIVLHARGDARATDIRRDLPDVSGVVVGDLEALAGMRDVAERANAFGPFDAVIHNAGVGGRGKARLTRDGLPVVLAVNVLAPYLLTALIDRPARLVYLSSSMHFGSSAEALDKAWVNGVWKGRDDYSHSKFLVTLLAFAVARRWPEVRANAVDPGWVPTRMGGAHAPDDLQQGYETQAWLAEGVDPSTQVTGGYFHHRQATGVDPATRVTQSQDALLDLCARITGTVLAGARPSDAPSAR